MTLFLSRDELRELTGRHQRGKVAAWLRENGYRFDLAADGWPRVLSAAVEARPRPEPPLPENCNHPRKNARTCLYRHFDSAGRLLYVGISLSAVMRLGGHRAGASWYREIAQVTVTWFPTRLNAMRAEAIAIRNERPLHNIIHARGEI